MLNSLKDWLATPLAKAAHRSHANGAYRKALKLFRIAHLVSPDHADIMGHVGACLQHIGDRVQAITWFSRSARGRVVVAEDLLCAAHGLARNRERDLAAAAFARAAAIAPDNPRVLLEAGRYCRRIGRFEDAVRLLTRANAVRPGDTAIEGALATVRSATDPAAPRLNSIIIGTTGICNASCIHCPTGKADTAHVPRTPMDMKLFRHLIDQLAICQIAVTEHIAFGLFGDGLVDPFVVERAAYVRKVLPDAALSINTNGAAYDPRKHSKLKDYATTISLHCESLIPAVYDRMMAPLRAERVHAKFPALFRDFPGMIYVSVPVSRANQTETDEMFRHFKGMGAKYVVFHPISARCARDQSVFDALAFAPRTIACTPTAMENLIIDCDGTVVSCCNDFEREVPVGKLGDGTLTDLLNDPRRLDMIRTFAEGRHSEVSTCARCRGDVALPKSKVAALELV